ncbi:UNVERIFIED_CONTAM: hypothetical protein FKN15_022461, partial [Acipenser sinensis]
NLYCDNFYSSSQLLHDLHKNKCVACGTIRENQKGFPCTKVNTLPKKTKRGSLRWIRSGELLFIKWMDAREVSVCSTVHKAFSGDPIQRRQILEDGSWRKNNVTVPAAVKDYNKHMGEVDLSDQVNQY